MCLVVVFEIDKLFQLKHFMSSVMDHLSSTMVVEEGGLGGAVASGEQYIMLLHDLMESLLAV